MEERHFPLVVFRFDGTVSAPELEAYLRRSERILSRGGQYAGVVLADGVKPFEVALIRRQAAWMKDNEDRLRAQSLGVALVLTSPMLRGLFRAILWIQPMAQPHLVCASIEEALTWVGERLREAGIAPDLPGVAEIARCAEVPAGLAQSG